MKVYKISLKLPQEWFDPEIVRNTTDFNMLRQILEREQLDAPSQYAVENPNCPPELLAKVLEKGHVCPLAAQALRNPNCPPEALLKWRYEMARKRYGSNLKLKIAAKMPKPPKPKIPKSVPKQNRGGNCYEVSAKYVLDWNEEGHNDNLILVHGEVTGQGNISGLVYGHSWIEDGDMVIDNSNGRNIRMPKQIYYAIGNIERTIKYNKEQTRQKLLQYGHWGPWELQTAL